MPGKASDLNVGRFRSDGLGHGMLLPFFSVLELTLADFYLAVLRLLWTDQADIWQKPMFGSDGCPSWAKSALRIAQKGPEPHKQQFAEIYRIPKIVV